MEESTEFTFSENFADLTVILTCAAFIVFDWENEGGRKRGLINMKLYTYHSLTILTSANLT